MLKLIENLSLFIAVVVIVSNTNLYHIFYNINVDVSLDMKFELVVAH